MDSTTTGYFVSILDKNIYVLNAYKENILAKEEIKAINAITYNLGSIIETARGDKFSIDVKRGYTIDDIATGSKFNIKRTTMEEIAETVEKDSELHNLIRNGWETDGKMAAGAGIAIFGKKEDDFYNCTFLESEVGKAFDKDKIQRRTFIKLHAEHLDAIFTTLKYDKEAVEAKAEALKVQRTTLDLG